MTPWTAVRSRLRVGRPRGALGLGALLLALAAGAAGPVLVREALDGIGDPATALRAAAGYVISALVAGVAGGLVVRAAVGVAQDLLHRLRIDAFAAVLADDDPPDDAQARLTRDLDAVGDATVGIGPHVVGELLGVAAGLIALAVLAPLGVAIALLVVPGAWVAGRWLLRRAPAVYRAEREQVGVVTRHLVESVEGAATLRELRAGDWALAGQTYEDDVLVARVLAGTRLRNRFYPGLTQLCGLLTAAVLVQCTLQARAGQLSVGAAVAAVYALGGVLVPVTQLAGVVDDVLAAGAAAVRVTELLREPPAPVAAAPGEGSIEVRGLVYRYPGSPAPVLAGLSLDVPAGTMLAVVGASGSGKSTLLGLLGGILRPAAGTVRVAGADPCAVPGVTALLAQHPLVLPGTVRENLTLVAPGADDPRLRAVLESLTPSLDLDAEVADDVPGGQVLGLAQLALSPARVLLLDEATTALGEEQEEAALAVLRADRTVVVASHRVSTVRAADAIAVLDGGRVVGSASGPDAHETLRRTCPAYARWLDGPSATGAAG